MRSPGLPPYRLLFAAALALAAAAYGCEGTIGGPGTGTTTGAPPPALSAEEQFAALEPDLVMACGGCHDTGGIADTPFLASPDHYQSILSWPGIVIQDWQRSLLLTHAVAGGGHGGTNLDDDDYKDTLLPAVTAWLAEEAKSLPPPDPAGPPTIQPFVPILGFNAVYFDQLDPDLAGVAITFNARELDPTTLELSAIQVQPSKAMGVHIIHPLLLVYPKASPTGTPDPDDTFKGLDHFYAHGDDAAPLGAGAATLAIWSQGAKLAIQFDAIGTYTNQGSGSGCIALGEFTAGPAAQFQLNCAMACHGGTNPDANAAVDMSTLETDPAIACAQIRNRINPADPPASQIFQNSDPNNPAAHPFKFNGDAMMFSGFFDAVSGWVAAEAPPPSP